MYGTVSQLYHRLKTEFQGEEKITLIIWRKEDVMKVLSDGHITEEAAARRNRPVTIAASDLAVLAEAVERLLNTGGDDDPRDIEEALRRAYHAINR